MKIFSRGLTVLILFITSVCCTEAQQPSPLLTEARQKIPLAFKKESECKLLYEKLSVVKNPEPILKGYIGGVNFAMSKHASLFDKSGYLKTGEQMLEEAIKEIPNTVELLFLRLTIQVHLPSFLGYNDNIASDKKFVLDNFNSVNSPLKERISDFIQNCDQFTAEEKARVKIK